MDTKLANLRKNYVTKDALDKENAYKEMLMVSPAVGKLASGGTHTG